MTLRRVIKTRSSGSGQVRYRLGPSRLYLDDLQSIYDSLLAVAEKRAKAPDGQTGDEDLSDEAPAGVEIAAGEAIADELIDLRDARSKELEELRISTRNPRITVDLWKRSADISAFSTDREAEELAIGIRDYINSRRSIFALTYHWRITNTLVVLISWTTAGIAFSQKHRDVALGIAALVVPLLVASIDWIFSYRYGSVRVIPYRESEARGLSSETRKQLLIALISAIAGGIIVALASLWAGLYVHH